MFDQNMAQYRNQDLSNPYRNMQNPYEDMTVNQQAADFQAQQQQQGMAATMDALKGAAGFFRHRCPKSITISTAIAKCATRIC